MIGRAGRPQYDKEGTAVIMTRTQEVSKYQVRNEAHIGNPKHSL